MPRGAQRGTEIVVDFQGERLADAVEIMNEQPGISVVKIEPLAKSVHAKLLIAPGCPLGAHALRVRTATGISPLRLFWVSPWPVIDEKEPNNDFAKAQRIPLNCTVHGSITAEDVDHFAVDAKKGQRLTAEAHAMRLGGSFFDAQLSILDSHKHELVNVDDTTLTAQDPCCSIIVPEDGTYIIRLREAAYGAGDQYRLHVGTMPRPMAVFPPGGRPGHELEVTFLGDPRGPVKRHIQVPSEVPDGRHELWFEDEGGISPSPIPFRVLDMPNFAEHEPNDTPLAAGLGTVPCAFHGVIEKPNDHDLFKFWAKKGQAYDVRVFARKLGSPLDSYLWISGTDNKVLVANDDSEGKPDSYIRFTATDSQVHIVGIRDQLFRGGPLFVYRIEVTPVEPHVELALARVAEPPSQERLTVTVPKGNRMAAMVNIRRVDWGGPLALEFSDLPAKLTAVAEAAPGGQATVPVLFEAAEDAPTAGSLATLSANSTDSKSQVLARYEQPIPLIYLANQGAYSSYHSSKVPIAIADSAPFRVNIVEPKAPLVRGGTMQLKLIAERTAEFKGPIRLQPLYNPAGVSAPGEVVIAEGQNETTLPLTASANAAIGKWKYALVATADVGGPMRVSSQLATLDVAQPFVQIALERANVEQGGQTTVRGKVTVSTPFAGPAKVKLVGLSPKLTVPEVEILADTKEISFPVSADATCPAGPIRNVFCQVTLTHEGEPVMQSAGTTELRVDVPLKNKPAQAKTAAKPTEKPLSRLEQLRKQATPDTKP
ncbi:MAG: PPC domain-containing protein [Gemmataceae bacterium]